MSRIQEISDQFSDAMDNLSDQKDRLNEAYDKLQSLAEEWESHFDSFHLLVREVEAYGDDKKCRKLVELIAAANNIDELPTEMEY